MVIAFNPRSQPRGTPIAGRTGVSPIGTVSPNTTGRANTNSTYAVGAYLSGVSVQAGSVTTYLINDTDYQGLIIFNTNSPITVTLNSSVMPNFVCSLTNLGTGAITLTPTSPDLSVPTTVNGASSLTMESGQGCTVAYAAGEWWAFVLSVIIPITPASIGPTAHEWINSYTEGTGLFTLTQPAFSDISGNLITSQLPTVGLSVTITTAALTIGGTQGSQTFTNGILTAQVPAT